MKTKRAKAPQWLKVDGIGWVKVKVTKCRAKSWTRGLGGSNGWDKRPTVDMSRRSEIHVTRPTGYSTVGGGLMGSMPIDYSNPKD